MAHKINLLRSKHEETITELAGPEWPEPWAWPHLEPIPAELQLEDGRWLPVKLLRVW